MHLKRIMILDDEDVLIENVKKYLDVENIKRLWEDGYVQSITELLNKKYSHDDIFQWEYSRLENRFSYRRGYNTTLSIDLCDLEMDREHRLELTFNLVTLHAYFKDKEKEEKFIQDLLGLFGNCMNEIYHKPLIEIIYAC